jgi:hypothetical protein
MAYPTDPIYKLYKDLVTDVVVSVFVSKNGKTYSIPFDENNTDYQDYLAWVAEGNTAEAAD